MRRPKYLKCTEYSWQNVTCFDLTCMRFGHPSFVPVIITLGLLSGHIVGHLLTTFRCIIFVIEQIKEYADDGYDDDDIVDQTLYPCSWQLVAIILLFLRIASPYRLSYFALRLNIFQRNILLLAYDFVTRMSRVHILRMVCMRRNTEAAFYCILLFTN